MTSKQERLDELVKAWQSATRDGRGTPVEEVCRDCPELIDDLKARIGILQTQATVQDTQVHPKQPSTATAPPGFAILQELGRGGMGVVYKAQQVGLDRIVALKVVLAGEYADPKLLARMQTEARVIAKLEHPNIVQVHDIGVVNNLPFLVLEYLPGGNLEKAIDEGRLTFRQMAELIETLARAVHFAHQKGFIHRDLKPGNVLLSECCIGRDRAVILGTVKITDFGLARPLSGTGLTSTGAVLGTPGYMAPEQAMGHSHRIGPGTDVFSLGVMLYEMLAGRLPFPGDSSYEVLHHIVSTDPALPSAFRPDVPPALEAICWKCLQKKPSDRYQTAEDLANDLRLYLDGKEISRRTSETLYHAQRGPKRWILGGILALAGVLAMLSYLGVGRSREPVPEPVREPIRIGALFSVTGPLAINGKSGNDMVWMAATEINETGGVMGHPLKVIYGDGESDETTYADEARRLIEKEKVEVLIGCWTAASRRSVKTVVEELDHLLIYPVEFEGLELSPNILYIGEAPNQNLLPALQWFLEKQGRKRWFVIGQDALYARASYEVLKDQLGLFPGAQFVGEWFFTNIPRFDSALEKLEAANADLIINLVSGDSNIALMRMLHAGKSKVPMVSFSCTEEELASVEQSAKAGQYLVSTYFQPISSPKNDKFLTRFHDVFDDRRIASDEMVASYNAVHIWAQAAKKAKSFKPADVSPLLPLQKFDGPGGLLTFDPKSRYGRHPISIGQLQDDGSIKIVWTSPTVIEPIPYPATRTIVEWNAFEKGLYDQWGGRWSKQ